MSYIDLQATARRNTRRLVLLFSATIAVVVLELFFLVRAGTDETARTLESDVSTLLTTAAWVLLFVGVCAAWRTFQLRSGGAVVARMVGGREVPSTTVDPAERTLRNVVEEMAIASGLPVPALFVLDSEPGMNAFAAGLTPQDAAVAVTRGTLDNLSRDELQGVVAHELAHIRNGDMRLDTRLVALQFGILAIGVAGFGLALGAAQMEGGRGGSKEDEAIAAGVRLVALVLGLVLMAVGFVGFLKARLVQAAVSRQREFLADASAVELTRNPFGLASALRKIARSEAGSRLLTPRTAEIGHLLFGEGRRPALFGLLATHPPIEERIRRLEGTNPRPW